MEDLDVVPSADPNVATEEQKLAKIQALGELLQLGTINRQEFTKRFIEATEQPNGEALMQMPEPQPDPAVEMEKAKMEFEQQKFQDESARAWEELEITRQKMETAALKDIADAEAAEIGDQFEQYKAQLKALHEEELHERKMAMEDDKHRLKMQHQEEINRQKAAQERSKSVQLQRDADGNISGATIEESNSSQV